MADRNYDWINVSLADEEMESKLLDSLEICYLTYVWAFDQMIRHWRRYKEPPTRGRVIANFTNKRYEVDPKQSVQKRSLLFAIQEAMRAFDDKVRISQTDREGTNLQVTLEMPTPDDYYEITINNRSKWKKYLEEYGSISTTYGIFYLEDDWQKVFEAQAERLKVSLEVLPWLWNSLSIRYKNGQWQVRFNYYDPSTKVGRRKKYERTNALAGSAA
jgi:hypothetical protein